MPEDLILEMKGISKSFPGVKVFEDFDFDLRKGEIHCICGENGAGKSTLIKMLSGAYTPDKGDIYFDGKKVVLTPHSAMQIGIQTIYQEHTLFPLLNVVENLFVGKEVTNGIVIKRSRWSPRHARCCSTCIPTSRLTTSLATWAAAGRRRWKSPRP